MNELNPLEAGGFDPAQALAAGFAQQVQAWAMARGAAAPAAQAASAAAHAISLAASAGHVCWPLAEVTGATAALLRASQVCGSVAAPAGCPLMLDDDGRLYLQRDFEHERALAQRLVQAARAEALDADTTPSASVLLQQLFAINGKADNRALDWQMVAAALALRQRLLIISGGPGTGKTTTVVQLLALLLATQPGCRMALAAPTGKAAARMAEALQLRAAALPVGLPGSIGQSLPTQASTVHRLLGPTRQPGVYTHHAGNPLPIDALVVDEASMLDLALARRLLDAVPPHARIVLLGDKDQLSAVESGAVFSDLSANPRLSAAARADVAALCGVPVAAIVPPQAGDDGVHEDPSSSAGTSHPLGLPDSVVWLTRNHRFAADSAIGQLAQAVQAGQPAQTLALLQAQTQTQTALLNWSQPGAQTLDLAAAGFDRYFEALLASPHGAPDPQALHAAFNHFRLLCALRQGPWGTDAANQHLANAARQRLAALRPAAADALSQWFSGRPVMVLRNDPALGLFNGDIGITLVAADGSDWQVWFADATQPGGCRAVAAARLPAHETAFAMTVHKAQGSEFDAVMVLLPPQPSRVLTRELLYTAITRARSHVHLVATAPRVAAAVATPTQRHSGLSARLREAQAGLQPAAPS